MQIHITQSIEKTGDGEFTADVRCYDADMREIFELKRRLTFSTLTYAGYNSLFRALDRAFQTIGARGVDVRLKSDCPPLVNDIQRQRLDGTLGRILAGKLEQYGMSIEADRL